MPSPELSKEEQPVMVVPELTWKPSPPLRDAEQSTTRQPTPATPPSAPLVRAVQPLISPPSPRVRPSRLFRAVLRLRSWLLTAVTAFTPLMGQLSREPLRTVTFVWRPRTRTPFEAPATPTNA